MPGLRATFGALLGAAGLLIAMVCLPAAATAANISITYAGPDINGDPYDLSVTAADANGLPILTMTAHVYNAAATDVADVPMTALSTSNPAAQTWAATNPIAQSALPAGTYTVKVDVTDADETDTGLQAPGFSFAYTSSLTAAAQPPTVTQGSQTVTFSGQLTGVAPGGTATPISGAPVLLNGTSIGVTTDSSGDFSYQATAVAPGTYTFSVASTATYSAASTGVTVSAEQAATTMTNVQANPANVTEGSESVTFTGTVQVTPANSPTVGIGSGVPVFLAVGSGTAAEVTTTDDANGDFTYTATDVTAAATYTLSVAATSLYGPASQAVSVGTQAAPTTMMVTAAPQFITYGSQSVTFKGTVTATPQAGSTLGLGSGVPVDLTVTTSQGSTSLGQVTTTDDAGGDFTYTATGLTAGGTYTFSVAGTSLYTAATYAVPVSLDQGTTAVSATASPPDINLDSSTVTFSGTVSVMPFGSINSTGVGSGVPVYLSVGGGTASKVTTTDDASGDFTYTVNNVTQPADYVFSVQAAAFYGAGSDSVPIGLDQVNSSLAVTASPASVTEGSESATFTGTLTGTSPEGHNPVPVPIAGATVDVSIKGGTAEKAAVTDSSGSFTYTSSGIAQATSFAFSVASASTYTAATADVTVAAVQAPTRFKGITATPSHLSYGSTAMLTGTVQYLNGTTWTPLPDAVVHMAEGKRSLGTLTADSTGQFTMKKLPTTYGVSWTATVNAGTLTAQTQSVGYLTVTVPVEAKSFTAKLGTDDKVSVDGCLATTANVGTGPGPLTNIQYSASKHGPWRSFAKQLPLDRSGPNCRSPEDSYFSAQIKAKLANAWYRVDFPATTNKGSYSFLRVLGPAVNAWKYPTRLSHFSMSPTQINPGQHTHLKAELEYFEKGSWHPWAHQKVVIEYAWPQDPGALMKLPGGTLHTNSKGWVDGPLGAKPPSNYVVLVYLFYLGDSQHLATHTKSAKLTVGHPKSQVTPATIWILGPSPGAGNVVLPELYPRPLSLTPLLAG